MIMTTAKHTVNRNNAAALMRVAHAQLHFYRLHKRNHATTLAAVAAFHIGITVQKAIKEIDSYSRSAVYDSDQIHRLHAYVLNAL